MMNKFLLVLAVLLLSLALGAYSRTVKEYFYPANTNNKQGDNNVAIADFALEIIIGPKNAMVYYARGW